ncbi:MAG: tetratricopeptide repeat protein [Bacteroidia bacterium]|nr:tetratricopeptide repeat protein [Bacteroidia bacterium]
MFSTGRQLIDHANYGAAREVFDQYLSTASGSDTRRPEAEYYRAFCALKLNHTDGEKLVSNFIDDNPSNPRAATAYFDIANFFYEENNYAKAIKYYKKVTFPALTSDQQSQAHFNLGYSLFTQKQLSEALEQFNFVKKQSNAYSPAASYYAGFIAYNNGQYNEALTDLKRAETSPSYASVVPYLIANVYYGQHKYDELIAYAAVLKNRKDVGNQKEISMLVADAYYFKKDYAKAVAAYEEYLSEKPDKAESALLYRAGYANYALNQDAKAIDYLRKAAGNPDSTSYYASYYLGVLYLKKGDKLYASNAFDYARKYKGDQKLVEESTFQFAKVSYDLGKPDVAIATFEQFLKDFAPVATRLR